LVVDFYWRGTGIPYRFRKPEIPAIFAILDSENGNKIDFGPIPKPEISVIFILPAPEITVKKVLALNNRIF